jgi:hypothetical protein
VKPRHFLPLLLLTLAVATAAEPSRTWTDTKGRTLEGTLLEKTDTTASLLLKNGNRTVMKLADLSQADRDYVAKAEVFPNVEMVAKTVAVDSNAANTKNDARKVEVVVTKMHGRSYEATIRWLGPAGNKVGIYKSETRQVPADGKLAFAIAYKSTRKGVRPDYRGYVVGVRETGNAVWSAKSASQKPFEKFLDQ